MCVIIYKFSFVRHAGCYISRALLSRSVCVSELREREMEGLGFWGRRRGIYRREVHVTGLQVGYVTRIVFP